jgi:hypothetical protein
LYSSSLPEVLLWNGALSSSPTVPANGTKLKEESVPTVFVIIGGAKFGVPTADILTRLYGGFAGLGTLWDGALSGMGEIPADGTKLKEESSPTVWVIIGGARFGVPDQATLDRLYGGWSDVWPVWDGRTIGLDGAPRDGTLLKDESAPEVFAICGGATRLVTSFSQFNLDPGIVRVLWSGRLGAFPTGPTALGNQLCNDDDDADSVLDSIDNCVVAPNVSQANGDNDLIDFSPDKPYNDLTHPNSDAAGDACDADDDNDGRSDADEASGIACNGAVTNPLVADTDGDLFLDGAECALGADPTNAASKPAIASCGVSTDTDGDKLVDRNEFCFYNTDPNSTDTDADGCPDGKEAASINADRKVSSIDLSQIAQNFITGGYPIPASTVNADFDINKDGKISSIDLSQVAQNFGDCA